MTILTPRQIARIMYDTAHAHGTNATLIEQATGTSICLAESGGNPAATGTDTNDRGLWQINRIAHPNISDLIAYDAQLSTAAVYSMTDGFQIAKFNQIWVSGTGVKSRGLNPASIANVSTQIGGIENDPKTNMPLNLPGVADSASTTIGAITPDWAKSLGTFLTNIISGEWWKRIGIGALGVVVILIALVLLFGKDAAPLAQVIP